MKEGLNGPQSTEILCPENVDTFLLCGGKGTRLKDTADSLVAGVPKPLIFIETPKGNIRMIDNVIIGLMESGFSNLTLLVGEDSEARGTEIENHIRLAYKLNSLYFSWEKVPLGTAGAAYNAFLSSKKEVAVITPIDTLFPFNLLYQALKTFPCRDSKLMWILTSNPGECAQNEGQIIVRENYVVRSGEGNLSEVIIYEGELPMTSAGVMIASRTHFIEKFRSFTNGNIENQIVDLYRDFIPWLLSKGEKISFFDIGLPAPDLGTPDRLRRFGRQSTTP